MFLQRKLQLIPPGSSLLVAFSGGADSVALVLALLELKGFIGWKRILLMHVNHMIRGGEAERDELFCREFAQRHQLPLLVERIDIPSIAEKKKENLESIAREERYRLLREVKDREGLDLIVTAHHLNDLVETVLLWLVRGCGTEGLMGFDEREGDVVRPLFLVKKEEIVAFVKGKGESWVEDSTNMDVGYARNRIRHRVIPELKKINPSFEENFLRLRALLKDEDSYLREKTKEALALVQQEGRKAFLKLHPALQRRVVMEIYGVRNFRLVEQIINSIKKGEELKTAQYRIS